MFIKIQQDGIWKVYRQPNNLQYVDVFIVNKKKRTLDFCCEKRTKTKNRTS